MLRKHLDVLKTDFLFFGVARPLRVRVKHIVLCQLDEDHPDGVTVRRSVNDV